MPPSRLPAPSPAMNAAVMIATEWTATPVVRARMRSQATWYTRPAAPLRTNSPDAIWTTRFSDVGAIPSEGGVAAGRSVEPDREALRLRQVPRLGEDVVFLDHELLAVVDRAVALRLDLLEYLGDVHRL